jgi:hypothetical protein
MAGVQEKISVRLSITDGALTYTVNVDSAALIGSGEETASGLPASLCDSFRAAFPDAAPPPACWAARRVFFTCGGVVMEAHRTLASYGLTGASPPLALIDAGPAAPTLAAEVASAEADVRGGLASIAAAPAPAVSRVTTLEGATLDVVHTADGASCGGAKSDSLHALLLRLSPRYGAWFFGRVAAQLAAGEREGGNGGAL